jgi:hypothetical protein
MRRGAPLLLSSVSSLADNVDLSLQQDRKFPRVRVRVRAKLRARARVRVSVTVGYI